jgi:hypothetical protein
MTQRDTPQNARGEPDTQEQARRDAQAESLESEAVEFEIINATTGVIQGKVWAADEAKALDVFARMQSHPNYEKSLYVTDDPMYAREAGSGSADESAADRVQNQTKDSKRSPTQHTERDSAHAYNKEVKSVAEDKADAKKKS